MGTDLTDEQIAENIKKELDAARNRLAKMGPFYRVGDWRDGENRKEATIIFFDRKVDKVKYGVIRDPFGVRYGARVFATYSGSEAWWFLRSGIVSRDDMNLMRELRQNGALDLPVVSLDDLTLEP